MGTGPEATPRRRAGGEEAAWIRPLLGRADEMRAEVWLRCDPAVAGGGEDDARNAVEISGTLTGPSCTIAATLPTTATFRDEGAVAGRLPLARAICTEPGFWTPELPCLYKAEIELRRGDRIVAVGDRTVGLRRLGTRGRSIWLDGRRFVPRAIAFAGDAEGLPGWRTLPAAAIVDGDRLTDEVSAAADRAGVAMVVLVPAAGGEPDSAERVAARIEHWSMHPSTLMVILPASLPAGAAAEIGLATARRRGTTLLGLSADGRVAPPTPPAGIDVLVAELPPGGLPHDGWRDAPSMPLLAREPARDDAPGLARAACDALQARLAGWGTTPGRTTSLDWAGFLVG